MNGSFKAKTNIIAEGSRFNDVMNIGYCFAMDTDRCLPTNPCKEDTRCLPTNSNGHACSTFVTPCTASPCMHGYCNITNAGYKCTCDVGYPVLIVNFLVVLDGYGMAQLVTTSATLNIVGTLHRIRIQLNSYITVTPILGKVFEYCISPQLNLENITELQFGFTKGLNPLISSFIISESKYDKTRKNSEFYMGLLDVKSAFDVVQNDIILDKLLDSKIHSFLWLVIKDLYSNLTTNVQWQGDLSEKFPVHQGVRQGVILSTHLYNIFVQDLLLELERNSLCLNIGNIFVGTPTFADDMAFIETNHA
ncbi:unnamed protein product [Mytilus coruscus]|uniref:Reverse transcriptase domain-containing protein n=1 Tax=Mytilus coruscus TaxID=42192 RepID=A0A6J8F1P5_MYTCO|nr:unnamed protein product [Mytilus coruscus]